MRASGKKYFYRGIKKAIVYGGKSYEICKHTNPDYQISPARRNGRVHATLLSSVCKMAGTGLILSGGAGKMEAVFFRLGQGKERRGMKFQCFESKRGEFFLPLGNLILFRKVGFFFCGMGKKYKRLLLCFEIDSNLAV